MISPLILLLLLSQLFSCFAACNRVSLTKVKKFKTTTTNKTSNKVNVTIPLACGLDETRLDVASLCVVPVLTSGTTTKTALPKKKSKKKLTKRKSKKAKKVKKRVKIKTKKNN